MKSKAAILVLVSLFPATGALAAGRTLIAPQFVWNDWYAYMDVANPAYPGTPGAPPTIPQAPVPPVPNPVGTERCIDISLTNVTSNLPQTVTVTARTVNQFYFTDSSKWPGNSLAIEVGTENGTYSNIPAAGAPQLALTWGPGVINPKTSNMAKFCGFFGRNPPHCDWDGDWHMAGAFDIQIDVAEDRGAITAVLTSRMENWGCQIDMNSGISALRNTSKTIPLNGGRPF